MNKITSMFLHRNGEKGGTIIPVFLCRQHLGRRHFAHNPHAAASWHPLLPTTNTAGTYAAAYAIVFAATCSR